MEEREIHEPGASKNTLRILTQNIWCHYLVPAPQKSERLALFLHHLSENNHYDVVCLQELFMLQWGFLSWNSDIRNFTESMKKLGFLYHTSASDSLCKKSDLGSFLKTQNSGLMCYSKLPISQEVFVPFVMTKELNNNKGFQRIDVQVGERTLSLFNCHLDGSGPHKRSQAEQIVEEIRRTAKDSPFVAVGDWNIDSLCKNGNWAFLEENLGKCVFSQMCPKQSTFRAKPPNLSLVAKSIFGTYVAEMVWPSKEEEEKRVGMCLDHVFVAEGIEVRQIERVDIKNDKYPVSDHYGICVELLLG